MSLTLKVMHSHDRSPVVADNPHSVFGGLSSVSFERQDDGSGLARCWQHDAVKTATVPGFVEHERLIEVPADAYVMNEDGKTVSMFSAGARRG